MMMWDECFRPLEQMDFVPATNIVKKDDEFQVVLAVPGYSEQQLHLNIEEKMKYTSVERLDRCHFGTALNCQNAPKQSVSEPS